VGRRDRATPNLWRPLDDTPFRQRLGDAYIADPFRIAHRADPKAGLWINEVLFNNAPGAFETKADALLALVDKLPTQHVPINGVGLQNHVFRGVMPDRDPAAFESLVRRLGERGVSMSP
jgi:endo-1,4-beta-xylanase